MRKYVRQIWLLLNEYQWAVIGATWLIIYILACIGITKQFNATNDLRSPFDPFYRAFQLFLMDDSMCVNGPIVSWTLEFSRFAAPAIAAYTALAGLLLLFQDQANNMRLRRIHGHVIVCGLGQVGLALARDFQEQGDNVVAIALDTDPETISTCREEGITVIVGDATESYILRKARVHSARYLVCVTEDDGTNVEIVVTAYRVIHRMKKVSLHPMRCFVHIFDLRLCNYFMQNPMFSDKQMVFDVKLLNVYQNCAQILFKNHPLDRVQIGPDDSRSIHLLVVGFGQMGESIALQAARIGHLSNGKKARVTVIDRQGNTCRKRFYNHYPQADMAAEFKFIQADADESDVLEKMHQWAADPESITTLVIALQDDQDSVSCALDMLSKMEDYPVPIYVRRTEEYGLTTLLESEARSQELFSFVHPFGMAEQLCTKDNLINEELDLLARAYHEIYVRDRLADGNDPQDASLRPWPLLDPVIKESNRQQADHLDVKLRAIGCKITEACAENNLNTIKTEFTVEEIELLAKMEHARFVAERYLSGFTPGARDASGRIKRSPYLVSWEELPEAAKVYNRNSIREIPRLLASVAKQVVIEYTTG